MVTVAVEFLNVLCALPYLPCRFCLSSNLVHISTHPNGQGGGWFIEDLWITVLRLGTDSLRSVPGLLQIRPLSPSRSSSGAPLDCFPAIFRSVSLSPRLFVFFKQTFNIRAHRHKCEQKMHQKMNEYMNEKQPCLKQCSAAQEHDLDG